jgi:hypothetical protein
MWTENKFQNLTFECHVDNKEWFTSQVAEKWCPKFVSLTVLMSFVLFIIW